MFGGGVFLGERHDAEKPRGACLELQETWQGSQHKITWGSESFAEHAPRPPLSEMNTIC
jgi:hypothetical protein